MAQKFERTESLSSVESEANQPQAPGEISDGTVGDLDEAQRRVQANPPKGQVPAIDPDPPRPENMTPEERVRAGIPRELPRS